MEDTLEDILDVTEGWCREMSDKEKLDTIQQLAQQALFKQHRRARALKRMARDAQEIGPYDHE